MKRSCRGRLRVGPFGRHLHRDGVQLWPEQPLDLPRPTSPGLDVDQGAGQLHGRLQDRSAVERRNLDVPILATNALGAGGAGRRSARSSVEPNREDTESRGSRSSPVLSSSWAWPHISMKRRVPVRFRQGVP